LLVIAATEPSWKEPVAWSSERLYSWGPQNGDVDLMKAPELWSKYYKCEKVSLNGKAGALFFDERYYKIYVRNANF